jgi:hypothetical protein
MELTAENFDETLERLSAKHLPDRNIILTPQGIVWNEEMEGFDERAGTGGLFCRRHSPFKHKVWKLLEEELKHEHNTLNVVNDLVKNIPRFYQKHNPIGKKYWNTSSSYGCKHVLSAELLKERPQKNTYCNNGQFILAMWILDYEMKPYIYEADYCIIEKKTYLKSINPNVTFNCSYRDLNKIVCDCGLQYTKASKKQHQRSKNHHLIMDVIRKHTTPAEPFSLPVDSTTGQVV